MMTIQIIKALHIIFVVTWFGALIYMFRLFLYHNKASLKPEPEKGILITQFKLMESRLWYYFAWPSAILTAIFGVWLLILNPHFLKQPWMLMKIFLVVLLYVYHVYGHKIFTSGRLDLGTYSTFFLRFLNEISMIILVGIVFLVELQIHVSWAWGIIGLFGLSFLTYLAVRKYRDSVDDRIPN